MPAERPIRVCIAGITGWVGKPLAEAVRASPDLELAAGISRHDPDHFSSIADALAGAEFDVLVDYTSAAAVRDNVMAAVEGGVGVVVGSSGLSASDYAEIDDLARSKQVGVIAAGNFSVAAALQLRFATESARFLRSWELVDYASASKPDAPSGTARELAERLEDEGSPELAVPIDQVLGHPEARGATIAETQVHSLRLPSFVIATEVIFGGESERLTIRYDAGESAKPYIDGTLLAIRALTGRVGLTRGLDKLLFEQ
jgi:4-hydroxy-tetrahydrodipicolinate reductase